MSESLRAIRTLLIEERDRVSCEVERLIKLGHGRSADAPGFENFKRLYDLLGSLNQAIAPLERI